MCLPLEPEVGPTQLDEHRVGGGVFPLRNIADLEVLCESFTLSVPQFSQLNKERVMADTRMALVSCIQESLS